MVAAAAKKQLPELPTSNAFKSARAAEVPIIVTKTDLSAKRRGDGRLANSCSRRRPDVVVVLDVVVAAVVVVAVVTTEGPSDSSTLIPSMLTLFFRTAMAHSLMNNSMSAGGHR